MFVISKALSPFEAQHSTRASADWELANEMVVRLLGWS